MWEPIRKNRRYAIIGPRLVVLGAVVAVGHYSAQGLTSHLRLSALFAAIHCSLVAQNRKDGGSCDDHATMQEGAGRFMMFIGVRVTDHHGQKSAGW